MPLDIESIKDRWRSAEVHYFPVIDSTMREAGRLAIAGAPHGTVVIADEQTAGVGRLGRTWHSERDSGIYCSILVRPSLLETQLPIATLMLGLATAEAIQKVTTLACDLRWPNDVLIDGRKTAGILAQLIEGCIIAGIGINVNQSSLPPNLRTPATSLRIEAEGRRQSREDILIALLESLESFLRLLESNGIAAILRAFTAASSYVKNRRVVVEENGRTGVTAGLDESGFLLVRFDSGQTQRVASGGVRPER